VALVFQLRAESGSTRGSLASVGHKLGINPETLRNWGVPRTRRGGPM
jgi:transposase-like protein